MISLLLASLFLIYQPSHNPPGDAMVELCNDAPFRVGFSVTVPSAAGTPIQKGWFNVEPGACLEGRIGETAGGRALVHARSGTWTWPSPGETGEALCVPPGSHEAPARTPPCDANRREARHARVEMSRVGRRYTVEYRVSCAAFGAEAGLCRESPQAPDGFARPVRELEVCNVTGAPRAVAVMEGGSVSRWTEIEAGACTIIERGYPDANRISLLTEMGLSAEEARFATSDADIYCAAPWQDTAPQPVVTGQGCADWAVPMALRHADFGPSTSRFTVTMN